MMKQTKLPTLEKKVIESKALLKSLVAVRPPTATDAGSTRMGMDRGQQMKPQDYAVMKGREIEQLPNDEYLLNLVVQFEKQCAKYRVDSFYSYQLMSHLKYLSKEKGELMLMREIDLVSRGKSYYHKIMELINGRERFLGILRQQIESHADDSVFEHVQSLAGETTNPEARQKKIDNILSSIRGLRLLNIELIEEVEKWKAVYQDIRKQATVPVHAEPLAFIYRNQNYLLKLISDVSFVSACQIEGLSFSAGNDPFILKPLKSPPSELAEKVQVDEALHPRIVQCIEILAREKTFEFQAKLEGANIVDKSNKMGQIKQIYQAKDPRKPKVNLDAMEKERTANSFDDEDEFDSLVRRYEKQILLEIKSRMKAQLPRKASLPLTESVLHKSPKHSSTARLKLLREDIGKLAEMRRESQDVKERIAEALKTQRDPPMIRLVEQKESQTAAPQQGLKPQQRSVSQPKLKGSLTNNLKTDRTNKKREKQKQQSVNKSLDKALNKSQQKIPSKIEQPTKQEKAREIPPNLDVWRSYSTVVEPRKRGLEQAAKMEKQSKLIQELKERLKEAEFEKEKFSKYQNYIAQRRSKNQKSQLVNIDAIPELSKQPQPPIQEVSRSRGSLLLASPYKKRTASVVDTQPEQSRQMKQVKPAEVDQKRAEKSQEVDSALSKLKSKLSGIAQQGSVSKPKKPTHKATPSVTTIVVPPAEPSIQAATVNEQDVDQKKKIQRNRNDQIKKIYSQKQNIRVKEEARPPETDITALKKKIEDEMRQKLLAELRAARELEQQKQAKQLQQLRARNRQIELQRANLRSESDQQADKREAEMLRNLQFQKQIVEEQDRLRKRIEEEAAIREIRLREQYEQQLRNAAEEYKRHSLELQYQLETEQRKAEQRQKKLQLEQQEKRRLEQQLQRKQLREELLKEIELQASKKSKQQQTEYVKLEMEKEMLKLRAKQEQMVLQLQQENLMRLQQLKRLREQQASANAAVQEQLMQLQKERKNRQLEKEKQALNNSSLIMEREESFNRSILEQESKMQGSPVEVYSPQRQQALKQQLKEQILREFGEREITRRQQEKELEEERKLKYQQLQAEYRKIFQQKRNKFNEQMTANLERQNIIREQMQRQREEEELRASSQKKMIGLNSSQVLSVEGNNRELLKNVDPESSGAHEDNSLHYMTEPLNNLPAEGQPAEESHEKLIQPQINQTPLGEQSIIKLEQPSSLMIESVQNSPSKPQPISSTQLNIPPPTERPIEEVPPSSVVQPQPIFEIVQHRSQPTQGDEPPKQPEPSPIKPSKQPGLAESFFLDSPLKQQKTSNFQEFARNETTIPNNSSTIVETQQDILKKWNHLRPHLRACKKKYIEAHSVKEFVTAFIQKQNREGMTPDMLPYSDKELNYILKKKQVDIFPNSVGWREGEKYILLGSIECLGQLSDLYGNIQVEIRMNMDSANPKEKRYFANRLRFYETVGYVYQKRLQGDDFAIKVIIKIPRGLKVQRPRNNNRLNLECVIEMDGKTALQKSKHDCSYIYPLANKLTQYLTEDEKLVLAKYGDSNYISKELFGLLTAIDIHKHKVQGVSLKQSKTELTMQLSLDIPVCLSTYPCLRFEANQIFNSQGSSYYISNSAATGFAMIVIPLESSKLEFDLDTYLKVMRKQGTSKDTLLWMPMWKTKRRVRVDNFGTKPFTIRTECTPSFDIGSIFEQPKGNCVTVKPPFIFAVLSESLEKLCECTPLYAEIVLAENLLVSPAMD